MEKLQLADEALKAMLDAFFLHRREKGSCYAREEYFVPFYGCRLLCFQSASTRY